MNEFPVELADIVEPVQAATQGSQDWLILVATLVIIISVLAVVYWWLQSTSRRRTLRRLRRLRHDFVAGRVTSRALAYAVALELRSCLQIQRLGTTHPVLARDEPQRSAWHSFVARLDTLRYQPGNELDPAQVDALLREAAGWARRSR